MHADKENANTRFGRLKAMGTGLILVAVGLLRMLGDVQVVRRVWADAYGDLVVKFSKEIQ
jgi:hypothetical protein